MSFKLCVGSATLWYRFRLLGLKRRCSLESLVYNVFYFVCYCHCCLEIPLRFYCHLLGQSGPRSTSPGLLMLSRNWFQSTRTVLFNRLQRPGNMVLLFLVSRFARPIGLTRSVGDVLDVWRWACSVFRLLFSCRATFIGLPSGWPRHRLMC